jgi:DivIVA domain-containing protein
MSANALDLPVLASAEQIRRREFVTIRRGYDPDQVRDYLEQVADQVERTEALIREARLEVDAAARAASEPRADPYAELATRVADVLRSADDAAERTLREAKEEAERILREARADADRIRTDAQATADGARADADRTLREAHEQADRTITGLSSKRDELVEQLATMQSRLLGVARDLESTIETSEHTEAAPEEVPPTTPARREASDEATGPRAIVLGEAGALDRAFEPVAADDEAEEDPLDAEFEALWEGTATMGLEMPDIPPLDLDWGDDEEGSEED